MQRKDISGYTHLDEWPTGPAGYPLAQIRVRVEDLRVNSRRAILAVLAHPDDESFGMGGTLALYASQGVEVYLVCATRGEAGGVDPEQLKGHGSIAALREAELRCAAQHLGLRQVYFLDYRDSGMPGSPDNDNPRALIRQPVEEVAARLVQRIRGIQPDFVLTFDPIGGYRHPDHIHIHKATVLAFEKAGDPKYQPDAGAAFRPRALYFQTLPRAMLRVGVFLLRLFGRDPRKWGQNGDIDLASLAAEAFPTHASINYGAVASQKAEASRCHASQGGGPSQGGLTGLLIRLFFARETYMRAYPPVPVAARIAHDLFDLTPG